MSEQAEIVSIELKSQSWIARNWRPALMFVFIAIIAVNYIVFPIVQLFTTVAITPSLPPEMWTLMNIAIGGYIGLRGAEKIATTIANKVSK